MASHGGGSMSWTSRLGNLGRFSPFTRSPQNSTGPGGAAPQVSDSDFSYITADDLRQHQETGSGAMTDALHSESPVDYGPPRDTDVVILRNKRKEYAMHFAAYSIAKGELSVGQIRDAAGRKMEVSSRRVKLLYKGKNLKDDGRKAKDEGLRDGSEVLMSIAEIAEGSGDDDGESGSGSEDVDGVNGGGEGVGGVKKRSNRGKKTKRRNKREAAAATQNYDSRSSTPDHPRNLDVPSNHSRPTSRPASPKPPPTPATPLDKLKELHSKLLSFVPEVDAYVSNPPTEQKQKDFEYKKLSETILTQVLLKLDGVETEGDTEARTRRKELVKETQEVLSRLDKVGKPQ